MNGSPSCVTVETAPLKMAAREKTCSVQDGEALEAKYWRGALALRQ